MSDAGKKIGFVVTQATEEGNIEILESNIHEVGSNKELEFKAVAVMTAEEANGIIAEFPAYIQKVREQNEGKPESEHMSVTLTIGGHEMPFSTESAMRFRDSLKEALAEIKGDSRKN